jgi:hypothetical protein
LNYMRQYHRANIITSDEAIAEFRTIAAGTKAQRIDADEATESHQRPSYAEWHRAAIVRNSAIASSLVMMLAR